MQSFMLSSKCAQFFCLEPLLLLLNLKLRWQRPKY